MRITSRVVLLLTLALLTGCGEGKNPQPIGSGGAEEPCAQHNPLRNVYFGDLHVHTTYSFDAHTFDVRTTPAQAYRFARGEPVALPPLDANGHGTRTPAPRSAARLRGGHRSLRVPRRGRGLYDAGLAGLRLNHAVRSSASAATRPSRTSGGPAGAAQSAALRRRLRRRRRCVRDAAGGRLAAHSRPPSRLRPQRRAPSPRFVAYEYSAQPRRQHAASQRHLPQRARAVSDHVLRAADAAGTVEGAAERPAWTPAPAATCSPFPHNSEREQRPHVRRRVSRRRKRSTSNARRRRSAPAWSRWSRSSSTRATRSASTASRGIVGAPGRAVRLREAAHARRSRTAATAPAPSAPAAAGCVSRLDFVRGALLAGLQEAAAPRRQPVPPRHHRQHRHAQRHAGRGRRGSASSATAAPTTTRPPSTLGHGVADPGWRSSSTPAASPACGPRRTRAPSIFDALRRREVFGTSGTRITRALLRRLESARRACAATRRCSQKATPAACRWAACCPPRPRSAAAPDVSWCRRCAIRARGAPGHAAAAPADRSRAGSTTAQPHQQVYDVAGDPDNGASVDLDTLRAARRRVRLRCAPSGPTRASTRRSRRSTTLRVVENPTCRWSTYVCNALAGRRSARRLQRPGVPKTIQERAWTSPIWYQPGG